MIRALLVVSLLLGSFSVQAQTRVRGMVIGMQAGTVSVRDAAGKVHAVAVGDATEIVYAQPIHLSDIKPGDFLGVTSVKRPEGLTAFEVRRFPKPVSPGHRPFDGRDDQTMTNATVEATVESTSARELTLTYEGGAQKIVVPASASVSTLVPGNPTLLVQGAPVSLTMDGENKALRIQVGPPPP